jgi:hypothetical protein
VKHLFLASAVLLGMVAPCRSGAATVLGGAVLGKWGRSHLVRNMDDRQVQ